jgi:hypothetical protein
MDDQPNPALYQVVIGDGPSGRIYPGITGPAPETDPDRPVPYTLTPKAEALVTEAEPEPEAGS